jgi:hypothetical protein
MTDKKVKGMFKKRRKVTSKQRKKGEGKGKQ